MVATVVVPKKNPTKQTTKRNDGGSALAGQGRTIVSGRVRVLRADHAPYRLRRRRKRAALPFDGCLWAPFPARLFLLGHRDERILHLVHQLFRERTARAGHHKLVCNRLLHHQHSTKEAESMSSFSVRAVSAVSWFDLV